MKELDEVQSINISPQDCVKADGSVLNIPSGKSFEQPAEVSGIISAQLPKRSKRDSSMESEEFLRHLNSKDLSKKLLLGMENRKRKYEYDNADDWEIGLDSRYTEDEIISILNIVSYWENRRYGFGHKNCEETYKDERENDKNNILFEEAMYGLELLGKDDVIKLETTKPRNKKKKSIKIV